jgi:hypothetical protein
MAPMSCLERSQLRPFVGPLSVAIGLVALTPHAGWAAAADSAPPTLKISGKASFATEARISGDGFEVRAVLSDEVGRPIAGAEVRIRAVPRSAGAPATAATLHRCGDPRGEAGGELLITSDKSGRVCITVTGMAFGSVELGFQDARGYLERASRIVSLPESVARSFEVGFDPPLSTLSLDEPVQEVGLVARAQGSATPPAGAELVLSMVADGSERELGRAALDGLGEVHRLSVVSGSFGQPGPARLVGRLRTHDGEELAQTSSAVMRSATVALSVGSAVDSDVEPGASLQIHAASVLGPAPSGVIEARSRGLGVAVARVENGVATLNLPEAPGALLGSMLTLEFVGAGPGWRSGPPIDLRIVPAAPGYGRYALWIVAAALAALAVVLGWRRPPRPRPLVAPLPPRARARVELLEKFGAGGGYQGYVRDAHDGTAISPAVVSFVDPNPNAASGRVLLQVRTTSDGSFRVEGSTFPEGTQVEVTAPLHATLTAPLPVPGVLELSLISRRRALIERLVRWAERQGKPWLRSNGEPTPAQIAAVAANEAEPEVERWARGLERLAFGPTPPDAAAEQANGVAEDPKTGRE